MMINENHKNTNLLLDINRISRLQANCLCARILGFYKAYGYNTTDISVGTENNSSTPADFLIITLAVFR